MPANSPVPRAAHLPSTGFDIKRLYHTLVERIWVVVLCIVVAVLATAGYIRRQPTLYAANAIVQVEQEEARVVKVEKIQSEDLRWMDALRTIEQTLKSRAVLERVVDSLKLTDDPSFFSAAKQPTKVELAELLDKLVSVRLRKGTRLLDVSATHPNPEMTAKIANAVVREFIAQSHDQSVKVAKDAVDFLMVEGRKLATNLVDAERALQGFRDQTKSVSLEQNNNIVTERLRDLNLKLTEANSATIRVKAQLAQVEKLGTNIEALLVLPVVNSEPTVVEAKTAVSKLEGEFASLTNRYKPAHPKYMQAASEIASWRTALTNAVLKVPQSLKSAYDSAQASEKSLHEELAKQEIVARQLTKNLTEYQRLAREVEANRTMYDAIQQRLKEATLTQELKPSTVQLNTPAVVPTLPVSPKKLQLMIRGLLAGIVLGVMFALGLNSLDSSLKTVDEAEEYLHLPVLGAVPKVKAGHVLVVSEDAKSPAAESFRTLRTSVGMLGRAENRRTFLITSAVPQEGKTFCSINFSLSLAQQGLKTLIIDGDLRRPAIEKTLMPDGPRRPGVTDYLTGNKKFEDIIQAHSQENCYFIAAGTVAPNPAELVAQGHFEALIEEALLRFDRVVVDSAPIHAVSDTLMMLNKIQTVCLVVRAAKTPRKAVARAIELLYKAEAPLAGIVLNRQQRRRISGGYDPYYTYYHEGSYSEKGVYGA